MTEDDRMEIESWRYSSHAFFVLPLSSGNIAILTPNRQFFMLAKDWENAKNIGPQAERYQIAQSMREQPRIFKEYEIDTGGLDL